ncbi:MAG: GtrA family protein [Microbacterium sp.]
MTDSTPLPEASPDGDRSVAGMSGPDGPFLRLIKDRRIAFLLVGGINTLIGFCWFIPITFFFEHTWPNAGWTVFAIVLCAQFVSSISGFVLYRRFVFRVTGDLWLDFGRFQLVNLGPALLNLLVVPPLKLWLGWPTLLAQLVFTIVYAVYSWFGHSRFSFRRKKEQQ